MNTQESLAQMIDHTLLKPEANLEQIRQLCEEAKTYRFFSVCVNSSYVEFCKKHLQGSSVKVVAVIGFPLGVCVTESKTAETLAAVKAGVDEIDMVLHLGLLKSGQYQAVQDDIRAVVTQAGQVPVKVILETHLLSEEEKVIACQLSERAGAAFVKTSTGFTGGGATIQDVALMKKSVSAKVAVKASGGVKTFEQAQALIAAGASRLGTSSGVALVTTGKVIGGGY